MHLDQQMQSLAKSLPAVLRQQIDQGPAPLANGKQLTPEQRKEWDALTESFVQKALALYPTGEMMADMAEIYQRHFTRDDVDAYIAFYNSPAGQHLLAAQPVVAKELLPVIMQRVQERAKALAEQQRKAEQDLLNSFDQSAPAAKNP
jgi:hypothetical protein